MKKLLLLFLMAVTFANAQVNVSENFETAIPTDWTMFGQGFTRISDASCDGTYSLRAHVANQSVFWSYMQTPNYISSGAPITASFQCRVEGNSAVSANAYFYYELNDSGTRVLIGSTVLSNSCQTVAGIIPAVIVPAGTNIKFSMQVNRSGGWSGLLIDNVNITQTIAEPGLVAEYSFDSTYNNMAGSEPFSQSVRTSFVTDRNSNPNRALNINSAINECSATITNLPIGNQARSVSIWVKPNQISPDNYLFIYGNMVSNTAYGISFQSDLINNFGWANDLSVAVTNSVNVWKHIVCTYDSTTAKIYVDGILMTSGSKPTWNTASSSFKLAFNYGSLAVDDLKIYNYALSQAEVTNLLGSNTSLSSSDFVQNDLEVELYPNPVKNILNVTAATEIKSVEIYNLQGQKVKTSNQKQVSVFDLAKGIYLVKIQDISNAISTQKIVKE